MVTFEFYGDFWAFFAPLTRPNPSHKFSVRRLRGSLLDAGLLFVQDVFEVSSAARRTRDFFFRAKCKPQNPKPYNAEGFSFSCSLTPWFSDSEADIRYIRDLWSRSNFTAIFGLLLHPKPDKPLRTSFWSDDYAVLFCLTQACFSYTTCIRYPLRHGAHAISFFALRVNP